MTVKDIYENALALSHDLPQDNRHYEDFALPLFNLLCVEMFHYNNVARERNGLEKLAKPAKVESLEDENPLEWQYDEAVVYGFAAKLLTGAEHGLEGTFSQMYYAARDTALKAEAEQVVDVYASAD